MENLDFDLQSRKDLLHSLLPKLENYYADTKARRVSADWDIPAVKAYARSLTFDGPHAAEAVVDHVLQGLTDFAVHTPHPNYFGLFNPRAGFASITADLISATLNPQLAAWSHAPFANEIENFVIHEFGKKFGYPSGSIDGTFCSGGAESNLTAVICALNRFFPAFNEKGLLAIGKQPLIYCSSESHHSIVKAAKMTGLGATSVRAVAVNEYLQIDIDELKAQIGRDRQKGLLPFMIIGTAGTTGAGAIDDLEALREVALEEKLWFHVDAAYGGAAVLSRKHRTLLAGIGRSDSITLDLHKWFSVPMGTSIFLTSDKEILHRSFSVQTRYMPPNDDPHQIIDPYVHSTQWSRRFIGLKIYLPLAIHGWGVFAALIDRQIEMGMQFRERLEANGWEILNHSPLPILCFHRKDPGSGQVMADLVNRINDSGKAWLSVYPIRGQPAARVCLTNYLTGRPELDELLELLEKA